MEEFYFCNMQMQVRFSEKVILLILVFVLSGGQRHLSFWLNQPAEEEIVLNELEEEEESGEKEESGKDEMETPDLLSFPGEQLSFFEFSIESNLITSVFREYEDRFRFIISPPPEV